MNLGSLLIEHPFADDEPLILTGNATMTAGEARTATKALAADIRGAGVRAGQAVAVQLPNAAECVIAFAAVWLAGAVLVPLNPRSAPAERATLLAATEPAATIDANGLDRLANGREYADGTAFVMWTSGTTGTPKPILHAHDRYIESLDRVLGPLRGTSRGAAKPPSPNLIPVSLALNAGLYNALFGLRAGAPLVLMERFTTAGFAELVARFAIRSTVLPPAAITMLSDDRAIAGLAPLRYVRSITAPLSPLQARRFTDRFGVTVLNGYGQAEIGEVIGWTAADAKAHAHKLGAAGRPHPGVAVRVVGDGGERVATNDVGRLLVKPPTTALGLGARIDADGFVDTGDLARVDDDGFVWIEGRVGEVINRGGNKVFPAHVEEVLRLSSSVTDAAVIGVPDERLGEVPVAFYVGDDVPAADLEALCREHLVAYKVPVAFHRIDELPRSEAGKLLRRDLVAVNPMPTR
jgi:acyl-CoA synthetase (AMP-forming)/AMP-acid ligase II